MVRGCVSTHAYALSRAPTCHGTCPPYASAPPPAADWHHALPLHDEAAVRSWTCPLDLHGGELSEESYSSRQEMAVPGPVFGDEQGLPHLEAVLMAKTLAQQVVGVLVAQETRALERRRGMFTLECRRWRLQDAFVYSKVAD
jgi:hypothetical protein